MPADPAFPLGGTGEVPWFSSVVAGSVQGFVHAFSSRKGGVSGGHFAALNLGYATGDDRGTVDANRGVLWRALGLPRPPLVPRQVHGNAVLVLDSGNLERCMADPPEADAVVTALRGVPLAVLTADCAAAVLMDRRTPAAGIVHAGWRGTVRSVLWKALLTMFDEFGTRPEDCVAAVGPSIAPACYPVGDDVYAVFERGFSYGRDLLQPGPGGRWLLDLREANRRQLLDARLLPGQVAVCGLCTHCESEWFYSARRDREGTGRQAAVVMIS